MPLSSIGPFVSLSHNLPLPISALCRRPTSTTHTKMDEKRPRRAQMELSERGGRPCVHSGLRPFLPPSYLPFFTNSFSPPSCLFLFLLLFPAAKCVVSSLSLSLCPGGDLLRSPSREMTEFSDMQCSSRRL
jgi:hypothetical protein